MTLSVPLTYRRLLAMAGVALFFSGADVYVFTSGFSAIPPLYWILAFGVLALPLLFTRETLATAVRSPAIRWSAFYAVFSIVAFMWSSQSTAAWGELRLRLLAVVFLISWILVLADERVHRAARATVLCTVALGVVLNAVDLARPLTFSPIIGRAAGLHINPNTSAIALVLGMVLGIELVPRAARPWLACAVGAGVLLTFSRGGAVAWVVATVLILLYRRMSLAALMGIVLTASAIVVASLILTDRWEAVVRAVSVVSSDSWGRLRPGTGVMDASTGVRVGAAKLAWQMFTERPLLGWGVGATTEWDWSESTHNIFLRHLAEYGVAGIVIVPLLVMGVLGWRTGAWRRPGVVVWVAVLILVWGVFSHNLLDERHFLISIALVAMLRPLDPARSPAGTPIDRPTDEAVARS